MKISAKEFERFKRACEKLSQLMGLQHFTRVYERCSNGNAAECDVDFSQHALYLRLGTSVDVPGLFGSPELCAIHEMCHALTWALCDLAADKNRALEQDELLARRFENMVLAILTPKQLRALGD